MKPVSALRISMTLAVVVAIPLTAAALQPPTPEQLERYRADGTLAERVADAYRFGNHRMSPHLAERLDDPMGTIGGKAAIGHKRLPAIGTQKVLALLISFSDYPFSNDAFQIDSQLFGEGLGADYPYESLTQYYTRSSHGLLTIEGSTLGWYTTDYPRSDVVETRNGREALISEVINYYDDQGHDFAQYDNDGDGYIDYFLVVWTGPHGPWADFWWGYQTSFRNSSFRVDGTRLGTYSWQWEAYDYPDPFTPLVVIHEIGHALGLPDYYDYDTSVGPGGGVGDLDMMDGNWGDHNCFSKWLLGWLTPDSYNQDSHVITLGPSDTTWDATLLMHGNLITEANAEFFMIQHRRRQNNDFDIPNDGLLIWHVDATRTPQGYFAFDNSYTDHKLLQLMPADGNLSNPASAGDFYTPGTAFGPDTRPSSARHDYSPTNILLDNIAFDAEAMTFDADLGSGCAVYCDASAATTAWPGIPLVFEGSTDTQNCSGEPGVEWIFGDDATGDELQMEHTYTGSQKFYWSFNATLDDASCIRWGATLTCADTRCWEWHGTEPMRFQRAMHAAIRLADGRVLVAGGGSPPEIYDPVGMRWNRAGSMSGTHLSAAGVTLEDGRVLIVGSTPFEPVNTEIYDPDTGLWSAPGQLAEDRMYHSATLLSDGRVMVAGGFNYDQQGEMVELLSAEIFDPVSETWGQAGMIPESMLLPGLTPLQDGRLLLTGGRSAAFFDPATNAWTATSGPNAQRVYHAAVELDDGRVLVTGGFEERTAETFDPVTETWTIKRLMTTYRVAPTLTKLDSGLILVTGGVDIDYAMTVHSDGEIYDPDANRWTAVSAMSVPRVVHSATLLRDGSVLAVGGASEAEGGETYASAERFTIPALAGTAPRRPGGRSRP